MIAGIAFVHRRTALSAQRPANDRHRPWGPRFSAALTSATQGLVELDRDERGRGCDEDDG